MAAHTRRHAWARRVRVADAASTPLPLIAPVAAVLSAMALIAALLLSFN